MDNPEIACDVLATMPTDVSVREELEAQYNFTEQYLDRRFARHQQKIAQQLGRVGLVLQMEQSAFDSPRQKLEHDTAQVRELLHKLGPTNPLRNEDGYDAGFEFAHMMWLLEADYAALSEEEKRPELRMTEGLLREELALLWRPATPLEFAGHPDSGFMFDLEDPNVFSPEEILLLPEPERWKRIGARLSDEAAEVFRDIHTSETAPRGVRLEARCRQVDMEIRSLRIQAGMAGANRVDLYRRIDRLNTDYMAEIEAVWRKPAPRGVRNGLLYELTVVAKERNAMIERGEHNHWLRLAMPNEDRQHRQVRPLRNLNGVAVMLTSDVIEEDLSGRFIRGYQVKYETPAGYQVREEKRRKKGRELVYLSKLRYRDN